MLDLLQIKKQNRFLEICGLLLLICEISKQLLLFFIIYNRSYNWWFFPFQLCSIPMYLCLIIPHIHITKIRLSLLTFLRDFGMLGGVAALIVSDGFRHIHPFLTIHGYIWHIMLIMISLYLSKTHACREVKYKSTLPVLFFCILIATIINISTHSLTSLNYADMFYINPYFASEQPIIHDIALHFGILIGHISYICLLMLGAYIVHILLNHFTQDEPVLPL